MSDFTHLHVHTEYSLLDGVNKSYKLLEKVKENKMDSVAITDHGVLYGVAEFWTAAKDMGVKPIIGCEMYLAPGNRTVRKEIDGIKYYHLLLIAKNQKGYQNLVKLVSAGHLEGMYYKPRIDVELLKKHSEGLICTSACLAGPLARHITLDQEQKAEEWLKTLHGIFGKDFYLEIQRNGIRCEDEVDMELVNNLPSIERDDHLKTLKDQVKVNKKLYEFSDKYKIPIIATTDAHYLDNNDKDIQKILFCIKDGKTIDDPSAMNGYVETYIKTPEEMQRDFADIPHVLEETLKIDEQIEEFDITFDRVQPKFWNQPKERSTEDELKLQVFQGAIRKYALKETQYAVPELQTKGTKPEDMTLDECLNVLDKELVDMLNYELEVIHDKGYDDYFLVVSDIMKWAARNDILTGVRGSVAGSVAGYCLDIVAIDPIKWKLYFERFLNPERPSPPDIDMDIQDSRRDELIAYVKDKYGEEAVAAICAIGRLKTKAAIRDVARVMDIDLSVADKLSKKVIVLFGKPFTFEKMMEEDPEFKQMVDDDPRLQELGKVVSKIEGLARHMSVHACGYLITPGPIVDYTSLQKETGGERVITQWEGPWIEELGLMKFDFLGLRTLSIIADSIKMIKENHGVDIDFWEIEEGDKETYELLGRGETVGVFQFESPPMQKYLIELGPESQEDLCFMAAAYRPGPMKYIPDYISCKKGQKEPDILVEELEDIVGYTYGFAIYQEQVIKIAVELGGYTMGGADILRRAMGKKKMKVMKQEEPKFKQGVMDKGYSQEIADELWNYMLPFADYGFNKAHAAGYAVLAYKCAYLKAHYPLEFTSALMHADLENPDRIVVDMKEAKRMGFEVLPPDINKSGVYFQPDGENGIRFGLGAIKNVGVAVCEKIIQERKENGEFLHLDDLIFRVGSKNINKRAMEHLVKAGALDIFGDRNGLLKIIPQAFDNVQHKEKAEAVGQEGLFSMMDSGSSSDSKVDQTPFPQFEPATDREKLDWEKELMGMFISSHPLDNFNWAYTSLDVTQAERVIDLPNQESVKMIGIFSEVKIVTTKKDNSRMAIVGIEDISGRCDGVIFPRKFAEVDPLGLVVEGKPYILTGKVNIREDRRSVIIDTIEPAGSMMRPKEIQLNLVGIADKEKLQSIGAVLMKQEEIEEENDKLMDVRIVYGTKGNEKEIIRKIDTSKDTNMSTIKDFIA